jgi:hypothetical protein
MLEQLQAGKHLSRTPHERLEQRELLRRECNLSRRSPHPPGRGIEAQVADHELCRPFAAAATHERPQAGQELGERERLRHVVVRSGIETGDAILDRVARGEHEHGSPNACIAQAAARLVPAPAGQHHVEDDDVVLVSFRDPQGVLTAGGDICGVALLDQATADEARHLRLVLHDQRPHHVTWSPISMRVK